MTQPPSSMDNPRLDRTRGGRWLHYDRDGEPITWRQWAELTSLPEAELEDYRRVGLTELGELGRVSTVWLGLDHNWLAGPPEIFETMVFGGPHADAQVRYPSRDMAITGHHNTVEDLRAGRPALWFEAWQEVDNE